METKPCKKEHKDNVAYDVLSVASSRCLSKSNLACQDEKKQSARGCWDCRFFALGYVGETSFDSLLFQVDGLSNLVNIYFSLFPRSIEHFCVCAAALNKANVRFVSLPQSIS